MCRREAWSASRRGSMVLVWSRLSLGWPMLPYHTPQIVRTLSALGSTLACEGTLSSQCYSGESGVPARSPQWSTPSALAPRPPVVHPAPARVCAGCCFVFTLCRLSSLFFPRARSWGEGSSKSVPSPLVTEHRAISGDLGLSRSSTPRPPPAAAAAAPRYLGRSRSVARAAAHLLKKGRARLEPRGSRARSVLAASLCATLEALARAGEAAPRAARSSPSTPTPARTAHLQPGGLPSPHLRRVRSVLRPFGACVHFPRARPPRLMPRPNQQHARLMPRPNPLPGWCQGSMTLLSVSPLLRQD